MRKITDKSNTIIRNSVILLKQGVLEIIILEGLLHHLIFFMPTEESKNLHTDAGNQEN